MFSQTLGTALGDWMSSNKALGYQGSALLIAAVLAVVAALYFFTKVSRTFLFWAAFILTRPLGAPIANTLDKPYGGLGINDIYLSGTFALAMILCLLVFPSARAAREISRQLEGFPTSLLVLMVVAGSREPATFFVGILKRLPWSSLSPFGYVQFAAPLLSSAL